jgi:cell division protease FtsH
VKQYQKTLLIWLVFGLFIVTVWSLFGHNATQSIDKPFSEVIGSIEAGQVKEVTITGQEFSG